MPNEGRQPRADHSKNGLWAVVARGGRIDTAAWRKAEAAGSIIGTCRVCGGYLVPDPLPFEAADVDALGWFMARCLGCGHEVASPGGRLCNHSGHSTTSRYGRDA